MASRVIKGGPSKGKVTDYIWSIIVEDSTREMREYGRALLSHCYMMLYQETLPQREEMCFIAIASSEDLDIDLRYSSVGLRMGIPFSPSFPVLDSCMLVF